MPSRRPEEIFVERLGELMRNRRAVEVAKSARISPAMLSRWKNGAVLPNPKLRTLVRLAEVLRCPLIYLISDGVFEPAFDPAAVEKLLRAADEGEHAAKKLRDAVRLAMRKP